MTSCRAGNSRGLCLCPWKSPSAGTSLVRVEKPNESDPEALKRFWLEVKSEVVVDSQIKTTAVEGCVNESKIGKSEDPE